MNIMNKLKSTKLKDVFPFYIEFITTNEFEIKIMTLRHSVIPVHKVAMVVFGVFLLIQLPLILGMSIYWSSLFPILIISISIPYMIFNTSLISYMERHKITEFKWFLFKRKVNKVKLRIPSNVEGLSKWVGVMDWFESNVNIIDYSVYTTGFPTGNGVAVHNYVFKNKEDAIAFKLQFGGE